MDKEISWDLYRSFLGVLRQGSISAAARSLGLAQPTIGRHIAELEQVLGVPLFTRSQTGVLPTEAANALRSHAEAMDSTAASLRREVESQGRRSENGSERRVTGTVRISASEVVGAEILPPILASLREQYPELKIELALTNRVQDLLRREADIAVRMTRPKQDVLLARRVADVRLGLHARDDYLARRGTPKKLADLADHALIGFDEWTPFLRAASGRVPGWTRDAFSLRTDSDLAQLALIRAGCGIGVCQLAIAGRDDSLIRVLPRHLDLRLETWIAMHRDLRASTSCKVTFDALVKALDARQR